MLFVPRALARRPAFATTVAPPKRAGPLSAVPTVAMLAAATDSYPLGSSLMCDRPSLAGVSTLTYADDELMPLDFEPGAEIADRYVLARLIGEGGMGTVWAAEDTQTGDRVALKFMKGNVVTPEQQRRFMREARAAGAVDHAAVVEVLDVVELEDGSPVIVMEHLEGESLAERLDRHGSLPLGDVATIMQTVVSAVGTAHAVGVVHRDLKPENIFLAKGKDGTEEVKVLDFGIAKLTALDGEAAQSTSLTGSGTILGTPHYMAPEQMFGEKDIDHRADIWAIGVMLYEALSGVLPTQADNVGQVLLPRIAVAVDTAGCRPKAGHDRCARWVASGRGAVGAGAEATARREAFQVRGLDRVALVEQRRPVVHVIDSDEQHVLARIFRLWRFLGRMLLSGVGRLLVSAEYHARQSGENSEDNQYSVAVHVSLPRVKCVPCPQTLRR